MKIVHISKEKQVLKTRKEYLNDLNECKDEMCKTLVSKYKLVPSEEPVYIVEMSMKELQLVSFYLELENRKPIMNVKLETEIKNEKPKNELVKGVLE